MSEIMKQSDRYEALASQWVALDYLLGVFKEEMARYANIDDGVLWSKMSNREFQCEIVYQALVALLLRIARDTGNEGTLFLPKDEIIDHLIENIEYVSDDKLEKLFARAVLDGSKSISSTQKIMIAKAYIRRAK